MMTLPLAEIITNQVPSICISIYLHMRNNLKLSIFHYDEEHFHNLKKITWAGRAGKWFPSSSNTIFEWVGRHLQLTFGHIELICDLHQGCEGDHCGRDVDMLRGLLTDPGLVLAPSRGGSASRAVPVRRRPRAWALSGGGRGRGALSAVIYRKTKGPPSYRPRSTMVRGHQGG